MLLKTPGFTMVAVLTLCIGIGASTTIFSQVEAVFWKPLPISQPEDLQRFTWSSRRPTFVAMPNVIADGNASGDTYSSFSYPAYVSMRDGLHDSARLACWADLGETRPVVMRNVGFGVVHFVSGNYFDVLRVEPAVGRLLTSEDDTPGTTAAVLSHAFWQRAFGGDPDVVHRTIDLNGLAFSVVGITPAGFFGIDASTVPDVIVPIAAVRIAAATANPLQNPRLWQVCRVFGRIPPADRERIRADAERWVRDAIASHPPVDPYEPPRVTLADAARGLPTLRETVQTPLVILLAVVAGIVLMACANIAGVLTVRGAARQRELATRLALGASRGHIVRQLLSEALLLSAVGGIAGVTVAVAAARVSPAFLSRFVPTLYGTNRQLGLVVAADTRVLVFAGAVTIAVALLFGLGPALRASRVELVASIKQPVDGGGGRRWSSDRTMVGFQAALSVVLLGAAGLLVETIANLRAAPLGYEPAGLLYAKIEPRTGGIPNERRGDYFQAAVTRVAAIPGVLTASATDNPPFGGRATIFLGGRTLPVCAPGYVPASPSAASAERSSVAPGYFATVRQPMLGGREFMWSDRYGYTAPNGSYVAIVNRSFANQFFAGQNALGRRFGLNCPARPSDFIVVGVVDDAKNNARQAVTPTVYMPLGVSSEVVTLILRTTVQPEHLIPTVRRAMAELNVDVPTFGEATPVELREQQMTEERVLRDLVLAFGAVALFLSSIGIYGMLSYLVVRRTRDIGVRMALGADRADVVRLVVGHAVVPIAIGLAGGAVVTLIGTRWIRSVLYGVSPSDPAVILAAIGTLLIAAAVAAAIPAMRAVRIDPLRALRFE